MISDKIVLGLRLGFIGLGLRPGLKFVVRLIREAGVRNSDLGEGGVRVRRPGGKSPLLS